MPVGEQKMRFAMAVEIAPGEIDTLKGVGIEGKGAYITPVRQGCKPASVPACLPPLGTAPVGIVGDIFRLLQAREQMRVVYLRHKAGRGIAV